MPTARQRVGIVGSGIAGAFTADFLRQALGDSVDLIVWERDSRIGGRVREIEIGGHRIEAGATLVHTSNRYLREAIETLGLHPTTKRAAREQDPPAFGCWNGRAFDFIAPSDPEVQLALLGGRYGQSLATVHQAVTGALERFLTVYALQDGGTAFATPELLYEAPGLYELTQQDGYGYFRHLGVGEPIVRELVDGIARSNYCQGSEMNAWATIVSLIGGGLGGGSVFGVREGNPRVPEGLLTRAGVRAVTGAPVRRIGWLDSGFQVTTASAETVTCDAVVIATPLEQAGIEFVDIDLPPSAHARRDFQTVHVTMVAGQPKASYFGLGSAGELPRAILTSSQVDAPFVAMGRLALEELPAWKLFSLAELSDSTLDAIFDQRAQVARLSWQAYPRLHPVSDWPPFRLAPGLYYTNAMESAVSTMETEAIAARNVALLLLQEMA